MMNIYGFILQREAEQTGGNLGGDMDEYLRHRNKGLTE